MPLAQAQKLVVDFCLLFLKIAANEQQILSLVVVLVVKHAPQVTKRISLSDSKQQSILAKEKKKPSSDDIPALCPGPMKATEEYHCQVQHQRRCLRKRKQHRQFIIMIMIIERATVKDAIGKNCGKRRM